MQMASDISIIAQMFDSVNFEIDFCHELRELDEGLQTVRVCGSRAGALAGQDAGYTLHGLA
jgi:hypothetical protein